MPQSSDPNVLNKTQWCHKHVQVLDMVVRQPQLLLLQTDMLGENFTSLQTSMGIPYAVARNMVQR